MSTMETQLKDAIAKGENVIIIYTDAKGNPSTREVTPEEFLPGKTGQLLVAHDVAKNEPRRFILSAITAVLSV